MYHELIEQWAKNQGFETWAKDHASVLSNLAQWLEKKNTEPARLKSLLQYLSNAGIR